MKVRTGFFILIVFGFALSMVLAQTPKPSPSRAKVQKKDTVAASSQSPRMTFDFKDTDIRDVVRSISIAYGLNIVIDKDIAAKVTIHLTDVPVLDGLKTLLSTHGLALQKEGDIYRIAKAEDKGKGAIAVSRRDTLNMDIDNMDVRDFIKDISAKTGMNIIAEKGVEGRISGTLRNISVEDGIRALFEANGFITRYRGDIIMVSAKDQGQGGGKLPGMGPGSFMQRSSGQQQQLDVRVKDGKVSLNLDRADIGDALKQIADQSQLNYITYGDVRGEVNAKLDNVPMEKAIGLLMAGTNYSFAIKDSILLVGDRNSATPSGQALSTSVLLHLKHIKADNFMVVLPKSIPATNVQLVKEQNAVLVTGTMDLIVQVQEFIAQVDIPTPQIMIETIVVEFSKDIGKEWGIRAGRGKSTDSSYKPGTENYIPGYWGSMSGRGVKNLARKIDEIKGFQFNTMGFLPDDFWVTLRAMESENKAKVMAQPRIATLNGNKASINVGVTRYFRLQGGTIENPFVRFQEIKSGIKLDITPWISQSGQVTVEISPEISNSTGDNKEGFPNVSTRSVNTTIQLNDGETIIIGGLIRAEDNKQVEKVPLLGDIPFLGKLFQSQGNQKSTSELVIYLTPHILKPADTVDLKRDLEKFKLRMNVNRETIELDKRENPDGVKEKSPAR